MEDLLTSNVFSFFKYSTREVFLKGYLKELGIEVSNQEAKEAEFLFWPHFEDGTEPDLVIMVGEYYLLIEAKYFSGFGQETKETKAQLLREIEGGKLDARNYGKALKLIAITADHYFKEEKFGVIPTDFSSHFKWTNWQLVSSFLNDVLESDETIRDQERSFALDLCSLLDKKRLRDFQGLQYLQPQAPVMKPHDSLFFQAKTAKFRGDFIGFLTSLSFDTKLTHFRDPIFLRTERRLFRSLSRFEKLGSIQSSIFYKGG